MYIYGRVTSAHYSDVVWASWCLKSPTRFCVRQTVQANSKGNIEAPYYWPFQRGIHWWPVDSSHKGAPMFFSCHDVIERRYLLWWSHTWTSSFAVLSWFLHAPAPSVWVLRKENIRITMETIRITLGFYIITHAPMKITDSRVGPLIQELGVGGGVGGWVGV